MAQPHAKPGEIIDVRPLGLRLAGAVSTALFKSDELEVARLVLHTGKELPEHKVPGEITVQCLEGAVAFTAYGKTQLLQAGELIHLEGGEPHSLKAIEDSSLLLCISLAKARSEE